MTGNQFTPSPADAPATITIHTGMLWRMVKWLCMLNIILLVTSGVVYGLLANPGRLPGKLSSESSILILSQFNLTAENTLATGYSSMLLLLTAVVAVICFFKTKTSGKGGWGWLIITAVFTMLSLDELGSLHENLSRLRSINATGTSTWEWVPTLPLLILVAGAMFGVVREMNWRTMPFWLMTAGVMLFLTVPIHEYVETKMWQEQDSEWTRPVLPGLIEEGTELFAALLCFAGMVLWMVRHGEAASRSAFRINATSKFVRVLLVTGAVVVLSGLCVMHLLSNSLDAGDGIAVNWFPATAAMLVFFVIRSLKFGSQSAVLAFCIALAGYFCCDFYSIQQWAEIATLSWLVRIAMTAGLVWFIFRVSLPFQNVVWRMSCIAAGMMISTAFVFDHTGVTLAATAGLLIILNLQVRSSMERSSRS